MTARTGERDALGALLDFAPTGRTAIEWRGQAMSYAELDAAVARLARRLVPRTNVLVFGPLCPAYLVALLATLRAGAVPVPIDAGMTPDQYAWAERVARPSAIVTSDVSTVAHFQGATGAGEVVLDAATGHIVLDAAGPETGGRYPVRDAGYLIPTSGSTGAAKAIVGSRTGLHAFLSWFVAEFGLADRDTCAAVTRVNFDPSLRELLGVLSVGGKLCLPEVDAQLNLPVLGRHLVASRPTIAFLVPSLARRIADVLLAQSVRLPDLRLGFFAGEVLPARVVAQWTELAPGAEFVNLYGLTEATLAQLFRRDVRPDSGDTAPVGRPRPGVSVTIDQPDPAGRGEVLIASAAPALGILGDSAGTFHLDPMPPVLHTGDMGFWTDHGELMIAGRLGNVLKVAGRRISFGRFVAEVEDLAGVDQCVVVDRQGPHAFVAGAGLVPGGEEPLGARVRAIAQRLGLPRLGIHLRAELPLLRSGKVDRIALAASIDDGAAAPADRDASTMEILLGLLGLDAASPPATPFVDAGLSSLDMLDFALEVNRRFGLSLSVQDCFGYRDVASLAAAIERTAGSAPAAPRDDHQEPVAASDTYPLSTRQVAYLATCMTDGNANWCNISREIPFDRVVPVDEVMAAIGGLIARHDVLRLALTPDWSAQTHTEAGRLRCPVTVHTASDADFRVRVQEARVEAVSRLIDPTSAPPIRAAVVHGSDSSSIILVAHHLFIDGLSLDLLAATLRSALLGQVIDDGLSTQSYRSYCLATRRTPAPPADVEYWRGFLRGAEQIELPEAADDEARQGQLLSRPFGVASSRAAYRLAAATGVSVFPIVLAAFELAVTKTFGLDPLTIVVPVQVREGIRTATAGMFMSQLIVRGPGADSLPDNARAYARQLELGTAHSAWEFDQRVEDLGFGGTHCFPLSTVLFNQHPMPRGLRARDLGKWQPRSLGRALRYQLQGELQMSAAEIALTYYYRRGIAMDGVDVIDQLHAHVLAALSAADGGRDVG